MYCRAVARRVPRLNLDSTWSFSFQPSSSRMPFLVFFPRKKNICEGNTTIKIPASLITRLDPNIWGQFRPWTWHLSGSAGFQLCQVSGIWWPGLQVASLKLMQFFFCSQLKYSKWGIWKSFLRYQKTKHQKHSGQSPNHWESTKRASDRHFTFRNDLSAGAQSTRRSYCKITHIQNIAKHHDKTMQP